MKSFTRKMFIGTMCAIIVGILSVCFLQGCGPEKTKTKFDKVYDKVGGDVTIFQYTDTTDVFNELAKYDVANVIADFLNIQDQKTSDGQKIPLRQAAINFMKDLWNRSGIAQISAVGTSVRPMKGNPNYYCYNMFLMSDPNPQQGIIWDMCPTLKTGFPMIEYVPENAWYASMGMTNLNALVKGVMESMEKQLPLVHMMVTVKLAEIQAKENIDVMKVLDSVSGFGYFVSRGATFKSKYVSCGITLVFRTVNEDFYKMIGTLAEKNGIKAENGTYSMPVFENIKVSIFKNGNDVLVTIDEKAVKEHLASKAKCLADNPDFAKLRASLPEKSSDWAYISAGAFPALVNYFDEKFPAATKGNSEKSMASTKLLVNLLKSIKGPVVAAGVKGDDGLMFIIGAQEKLPLLLLAQ